MLYMMRTVFKKCLIFCHINVTCAICSDAIYSITTEISVNFKFQVVALLDRQARFVKSIRIVRK